MLSLPIVCERTRIMSGIIRRHEHEPGGTASSSLQGGGSEDSILFHGSGGDGMLSRGTLVCTLARVFLIVHARAYIWYCIISHIKLFTSNHALCAYIVWGILGRRRRRGEVGRSRRSRISQRSVMSRPRSAKQCYFTGPRWPR